MKTSTVFDSDQRSFKVLKSSLFRLVPPATHKISLTKPNGFLGGLSDLVGKYSVKNAKESLLSLSSPLLDAPFQQPIYFDFLVHTKTVSKHEPCGIPVFCFRNKCSATAPSVDVLFTPLSMYVAARLSAELAPNAHRMSHVWYGEDSELTELVGNMDELVSESLLHRQLRPAGVLVENNNSSFLSRVTVLSHGPMYLQKSQQPLSLVIPKDLFVDLDSSSSQECTSIEPNHGESQVYCTLTYVTNADNTKPVMTFFKSSQSYFEVLLLIQMYFTDVITNKFVTDRECSINGITFGVVCRLGHSSGREACAQESLYYRGSSLLVVKIPGFFVDYSSWQIIL